MQRRVTPMEPACEGHPQIAGVTDGVHAVVRPPDVREEPVLEGSSEVDGMGAWASHGLRVAVARPGSTDAVPGRRRCFEDFTQCGRTAARPGAGEAPGRSEQAGKRLFLRRL